MTIVAMVVLLTLAATTHAQPGGGAGAPMVPLAGGGAKITNVGLNQNGTVTISGTYFTNRGWAPDSIQVYFSDNLAAGNKVLLMDAGAPTGGTWTVTTPAVAAGAYVAWVLFEIDDGVNIQTLTDPLQNINAPGPGGAIGAPTNTVTWGAVARNAGNQLVGNGNWAKAGTWNFGYSAMYCLPVGGGVVDTPAITFAGNNTWTSTSTYAFAPTTFYNVVPVAFAGNGAANEVTCGDVKVNK